MRPVVLVAFTIGIAACSSKPSTTSRMPTGDTAPLSLDSTFATDGYGDNGTWHGFLFTLATGEGSTISPECSFDGSTPCFTDAGAELCFEGSLGLGYDRSGMLLWNVGQTPGDRKLDSWTIAGAGVTVDLIDRQGDTPVYLTITSPSFSRWCARVPESGQGTIPWRDFSPQCWIETGEQSAPPPGTAIQSIALQVLGNPATSQHFDLCLIDLAPAR